MKLVLAVILFLLINSNRFKYLWICLIFVESELFPAIIVFVICFLGFVAFIVYVKVQYSRKKKEKILNDQRNNILMQRPNDKKPINAYEK